MTTASAFHPTATTAALLISLANEMPTGDSLARDATRLARKLNRPHPRALDNRAADLLAALLSATDAGLACDDELLLDSHFDD